MGVRRWLVVIVGCSAAGVVPAALDGQRTSSPHVVILTTGGTIASRTDAPVLEGSTLVGAVPALRDHARITVEEFSRIGSSQMTPDHWLRLSTHLENLFDRDPDIHGVVITHGTDTMEETAFFLNLTVNDPRPVVLVGSMRSADALSPDGPANLLNAVRVAADPTARGMGVLIVLNNEINAARDAWKTDNQRVHTFRSPELGVLGFADDDAIIFYRQPVRPHTDQSSFTLDGVTMLPRVEMVVDYPGFDGSLVRRVMEEPIDGLVAETFAGGRMSPGMAATLETAVANGVPVVVASRVPGGRISGEPRVQGTVLARDLAAHKARILLMLALTLTTDAPAIQDLFDRH